MMVSAVIRSFERAINFVRDGGIYVSSLLRDIGMFTKSGQAQAEDPVALLSNRELEVFSYLLNGLRPIEIAGLLAMSP